MPLDVLLVHQVLSGDDSAFHRLMKKYQTAIYAFILSRVKNPADAEELTQDVFWKAYQNLYSLRQPARFYPWLLKIAKNHCHDWQRKKHSSFLSMQEADFNLEIPPADELIILREAISKVLEVVEMLPEVEKKLFKERYLEDASYEELQTKHGLSYKAVTMRLVKARRKVREKVLKMLSGVAAFPLRDFMEKLFLGGVGAMKISATTKLVTVWTATLLIVGGITVSVWHTKSPKQEMSKPIATQSAQETPTKSFGPSFSKQKSSVTPIQKPSVSPPVTGSVETEEPVDDADLEELLAELGEELLETAPSEEMNAHLEADSPESGGDVEQEVASIVPCIYDGVEEYRGVDADYHMPGAPHEVQERRTQAMARLYELESKLKDLAFSYCLLTQSTAPLAPGGWIQQLFADGVMKVELNPVEEEGELIRITTTPLGGPSKPLW